MEERSAPGLVDSRYKMAAGKIPARGSSYSSLAIDIRPYRLQTSCFSHHAVCGAMLSQIQIKHSFFSLPSPAPFLLHHIQADGALYMHPVPTYLPC